MSPKYLMTENVGLKANEIKLLQIQLAETEKHNATLQHSITTLEKQNDRLYKDKNASVFFVIVLAGVCALLSIYILLKG